MLMIILLKKLGCLSSTISMAQNTDVIRKHNKTLLLI